ncbi:MAG: diguanylate cyclase [Pseudomonadales bacterium]
MITLLPLSGFYNHAAANITGGIQAGQIDLTDWDVRQQPSIDLSGKWKFFPNPLIDPQKMQASISEASASNPTYLQVPSSWNRTIEQKLFPSLGNGVGSYWLSIKGANTTIPLSLAINRRCSNASIFFFPEGSPTTTPLATLGQVSNTSGSSASYTGSKLISLPMTAAGIHHLLIHVSNVDFRSGDLCGEITLGSTDHLNQQSTRNVATQSILIAMIFMAAIYSLALFTQHPKNRSPMWLMLTCFGAAAFFLAVSGLLEQLMTGTYPWAYELRIKLIFMGLSWSSVSLLMFYSSNFPGIIPSNWLKFTINTSLLCTVFFLITPASLMTALVHYFVLYWVLQFMMGLWILGQALRDRKPCAKPMFIAIIPLLFSIPFDSYNYIALNGMHLLSPYCLIFFIFIESQIIGRKVFKAFNLADKLSRNFKEEVALQTHELNQQNKKLEHAKKSLQSVNDTLKKLSITDGLTQVYNRMHFEQEFHKEWRRCARQRTPISILMIDADHFKRLNDSAGHLIGDQALLGIGRELHNHFKRAGELVARYGGEEFVVMLPETDQRKSLEVAESLRQAIENLVISYRDKHYSITVSVGISTTIPSMSYSPDHLLGAADAALYDAKNNGRNRVSIIPLLPSQPIHRGMKKNS